MRRGGADNNASPCLCTPAAYTSKLRARGAAARMAHWLQKLVQ